QPRTLLAAPQLPPAPMHGPVCGTGCNEIGHADQHRHVMMTMSEGRGRVLGVTDDPDHLDLAARSTGGVTDSRRVLKMVYEGVIPGDAADLIPQLARGSVALFFTSPPYADQRAYSRIHPDSYVEWFLPFASAMFEATAESGSLVLNIKNRVANRGPLKGQRHP